MGKDGILLGGGGGNILEMAAAQRRENVGDRIDAAVAGEQAGAVLIAMLERVQAIAENPQAPKGFKLGVIAMLGGLIVDLTK